MFKGCQRHYVLHLWRPFGFALELRYLASRYMQSDEGIRNAQVD